MVNCKDFQEAVVFGQRGAPNQGSRISILPGGVRQDETKALARDFNTALDPVELLNGQVPPHRIARVAVRSSATAAVRALLIRILRTAGASVRFRKM